MNFVGMRITKEKCLRCGEPMWESEYGGKKTCLTCPFDSAIREIKERREKLL